MSARKFDISKAKKYGNVKIEKSSEHDGLYTQVLLHDNVIMTINHTQKWFKMSHCDWPTPTTKTALNTELKQIRPDVNVYQVKGVWFVSFAQGDEIVPFSVASNNKYGI